MSSIVTYCLAFFSFSFPKLHEEIELSLSLSVCVLAVRTIFALIPIHGSGRRTKRTADAERKEVSLETGRRIIFPMWSTERERERNFSTVRKEETGYDPELSLARSSSGLFADKISVYRNKAAGNRHKEAWGVNADQQQCVYWGILALLTL